MQSVDSVSLVTRGSTQQGHQLGQAQLEEQELGGVGRGRESALLDRKGGRAGGEPNVISVIL